MWLFKCARHIVIKQYNKKGENFSFIAVFNWTTVFFGMSKIDQILRWTEQFITIWGQNKNCNSQSIVYGAFKFCGFSNMLDMLSLKNMDKFVGKYQSNLNICLNTCFSTKYESYSQRYGRPPVKTMPESFQNHPNV